MTQKSNESKHSFRKDDHGNEVQFIGGPLDGEQWFVDESPHIEFFVYRCARIEYLYRYRQIEESRFVAEYDGWLVIEPSSKRSFRIKAKIFTLLLASVAFIAAIVIWFTAQYR